MKHADNFCTLFVNGRGVKVIDALVAFRTNWMRHRTGIFLELRCTQEGYVMDALYGTRRRRAEHIGGKLLITKHRQPFFQSELEPIAQSYTVARPVVEVFVTDDTFNAQIIRIGCHGWVGKRAARVEDVQALIFHGPEIEIVGSNDLEVVQVELQPPALFIPADGAFQAFECVLSLVEILRLNPNREVNDSAVLQLEFVGTGDEMARYQCEKIGGLEKWINIDHFAAAVFEYAVFGQIAV